jgi:phthalate 4,5-dioxygenase oxygenase subunit
MLTFEENQTLARVGPGTPTGALMRRYWIPSTLSWELPDPDCPPIRVRLLGEDLIAFRDTSGMVGVLDNYCPHRRASMFFGRNEECGLRCVYHGWKFDVDGNCVDMPSEPAESNFKDKVKIAAYATAEFGGIIWVYMGPPDLKPPLPSMEWTQVPDEHRGITKVVQRCNWLQGLEGGIDTVHTNFLHRNLKRINSQAMAKARGRSMAAHVEVAPTDYGYTYAGIRPISDEEGDYVRTYHFVAPFYQLRPNQLARSEGRASGHIWVPIDDENTLVWNFSYRFDGQPMTESERAQTGTGNEFGKDIIVEEGFRSLANSGNDYYIDREAQKTETYSGIPGTNTQDRAVQDTMGPICDRTKEHLGTTDRAIIMARKILMDAVKTVEDGGTPPGLGSNVHTLRPIEKVLPVDIDWQNALSGELYDSVPYSTEYVPV